MKMIRAWLLVFVVGLILSGATAFPLVAEVRLLSEVLRSVPAPDGLVAWVDRVRDGLIVTDANYPFIAYGTDWLAFAHLVIAAAFWGPWRDPVRNIWVIEWGMICCAAIIPLALIAGPVRQIPFWWTVIELGSLCWSPGWRDLASDVTEPVVRFRQSLADYRMHHLRLGGHDPGGRSGRVRRARMGGGLGCLRHRGRPTMRSLRITYASSRSVRLRPQGHFWLCCGCPRQ